jgi:hypothetical protein
VCHLREILRRGTSADLQLHVYEKARAAGVSEQEAPAVVVDWLIGETTIGASSLMHASQGNEP